MQKKGKNYLILGIIILVLLVTVFIKNLSYDYTMQGNELSVMHEYYTSATGYEVSNVDGLWHFEINGEDPQFYLMGLENLGSGIGGIEIIFEKSMMTEEELPIQVFYVKSGQSFTERHSKKAVYKSDVESVKIPVSFDKYSTLRFDIDGNFVIKDVRICTEKMLSNAYVSADTINVCMWYFPVIIVGVILIYMAHMSKKKKMEINAKEYIKSIFVGAESSKKRAVHYDYMRLLAVILVILAHACSPMVDMADSNWKRFVLVCGLSLGLCCNLIYVMLSGTLLLSSKGKNGEERVISFYIRRASKVIIPLVMYYLLLLSLNGEVGFLPPENIGNAFKRIVTGAPDVGPHLWLIYTIVALYFVTPFFKVMVQHLSDRMLFSLAIVILALNAIITYLPLFGMVFGATTFLAGWEGVFLLGYVMSRQNKIENSQKRNNTLICLAVIAYIITVIVVYMDSSKMNYVYNNSPTMILLSCGIFAAFLKNKSWFENKSNFLVNMCSKYSYSIILIHWYALFVVVQSKMHVTALRFGCAGGIIATVVLTFIVCLVIAIVYDNTVVIVCDMIFDKSVHYIWQKYKKIKQTKICKDN